MKHFSIEETESGYKFEVDGSYFYADKVTPPVPVVAEPIPAPEPVKGSIPESIPPEEAK